MDRVKTEKTFKKLVITNDGFQKVDDDFLKKNFTDEEIAYFLKGGLIAKQNKEVKTYYINWERFITAKKKPEKSDVNVNNKENYYEIKCEKLEERINQYNHLFNQYEYLINNLIEAYKGDEEAAKYVDDFVNGCLEYEADETRKKFAIVS